MPREKYRNLYGIIDQLNTFHASRLTLAIFLFQILQMHALRISAIRNPVKDSFSQNSLISSLISENVCVVGPMTGERTAVDPSARNENFFLF